MVIVNMHHSIPAERFQISVVSMQIYRRLFWITCICSILLLNIPLLSLKVNYSISFIEDFRFYR